MFTSVNAYKNNYALASAEHKKASVKFGSGDPELDLLLMEAAIKGMQAAVAQLSQPVQRASTRQYGQDSLRRVPAYDSVSSFSIQRSPSPPASYARASDTSSMPRLNARQQRMADDAFNSFRSNCCDSNGYCEPRKLQSLGSGQEGTVYALDDQYVYKHKADADKTFQLSDVRPSPSRQLFALSTGHNLGHKVVNIKSQDGRKLGNVQRRVPGEADSVDWFNGNVEETDAANTRRLKQLAELPGSAYRELHQDAALLRNAGYVYDPNPRNLIHDPQGQRLGIVDIKRSTRDRPGMANGPDAGNDNHLMNMTIEPGYGIERDQSPSMRPNADLDKIHRRRILKKHAEAMSENTYSGRPPFLLSEQKQRQIANEHPGANTFTTADTYQQGGLDRDNWRSVETALRKQQPHSPESRSGVKRLVGKVLGSKEKK